MDTKRCLELLNQFEKVRLLAIGDIYLDEYVYGVVTEISLEAPIPVVEVQERRYNPGASGNAACNAASLGAQVTMLGVIGTDTNGGIIRREFQKRNVNADHLTEDPGRPTNTYGKWRAGDTIFPRRKCCVPIRPGPK